LEVKVIRRWYFASDSITLGHPDKMCDFISDSVLDMTSSNDELSKMAVERSIKDNKIWIFGEAKTKARLNYTEIVNTALKINKIK
jgi:S-adenosylmethionine synthetase